MSPQLYLSRYSVDYCALRSYEGLSDGDWIQGRFLSIIQQQCAYGYFLAINVHDVTFKPKEMSDCPMGYPLPNACTLLRKERFNDMV